MTWSIPIRPLQYHSLVHSNNNSYFFLMESILDVKLTCIFLPVSPLCTLYRRQFSVLQHKFLIHICFLMLLWWHWIMFCTLFWCRIRFLRFISTFPTSTYIDEQQHHSTTLPSYHLYRDNIEQQGFITSIWFKTY